jgi:hypothetical protein
MVHFFANVCIRLHLFAGSAISRKVTERLFLQGFRNFLGSEANVAQLVEQRFRKARVVSSILTVGSIPKSFHRVLRF